MTTSTKGKRVFRISYPTSTDEPIGSLSSSATSNVSTAANRAAAAVGFRGQRTSSGSYGSRLHGIEDEVDVIDEGRRLPQHGRRQQHGSFHRMEELSPVDDDTVGQLDDDSSEDMPSNYLEDDEESGDDNDDVEEEDDEEGREIFEDANESFGAGGHSPHATFRGQIDDNRPILIRSLSRISTGSVGGVGANSGGRERARTLHHGLTFSRNTIAHAAQQGVGHRRLHATVVLTPRRRLYVRKLLRRRLGTSQHLLADDNVPVHASVSASSQIGSIESLAIPEGEFRFRLGTGSSDRDPKSAIAQEIERGRSDFHTMVSRMMSSLNSAGKSSAANARSTSSFLLQQQQLQRENSNSSDPFASPLYQFWLELKAWHAGQPLPAYIEQLAVRRKAIQDKLQEAVDFHYTRLFEDDPIDVAAIDISHENLAEEIRAQGEVERLLERIAELEQLYPSMRLMGLDIPFYSSPVFQQRYQALCYWINHCYTMHRQLRILASIFYLSKPAMLPTTHLTTQASSSTAALKALAAASAAVEENGSTSGTWWSSIIRWLCETATMTAMRRPSIPQHQHSAPTGISTGHDDSLYRSVLESQFSIGATSGLGSEGAVSPPHPRLFPSSSLVRQLSASNYRAFVEKVLKRTAVSKLQKRFQDLVCNKPMIINRLNRQTSTDDEFEEQATMHQADLAAIRQAMIAASSVSPPGPVPLGAVQPGADAGALAHIISQMSNDPAALVKPDISTTSSEMPIPLADTSLPAAVVTVAPSVVSGAPTVRQYSRPVTYQESFADDRGMHDAVNDMGLPTLKTTYLFLCRVPLDVIHECVRFRLEQYLPCKTPSELSIRQLLKECKEVLQGAVRAIDQYQRLVLPFFADSGQFEDIKQVLCIERFYEDIRKLLDVYFSYLGQMLNYISKSEGSDSAPLVKKILSEEWVFIRRIVPFIAGAEEEACNRFCMLGVKMLQAIEEYMTKSVANCLKQLKEEPVPIAAATTSNASTDDSDVVLVMNVPRLGPNGIAVPEETAAAGKTTDTIDEESKDEEEQGGEEEEDQEDEEAEEEDDEVGEDAEEDPSEADEAVHAAAARRAATPKNRLLKLYRICKVLFKECRDRALSATYFLRHLRKDVENTSHYNLAPNVTLQELFGKLEIHGFSMVTTPFVTHASFCAFVPAQLKNKTTEVTRLFNLLCGYTPPGGVMIEGYLVLLAATPDIIASWKGPTISAIMPVQTLIALSHIRVDGLFLVAANLIQQQPRLHRRLAGSIIIHCEQTSPHEEVANTLRDMKNSCLHLIDRIDQTITEMLSALLEFVLKSSTEIPSEEVIDLKTLLAKTLGNVFVSGFDYIRSASHLMTGPLRQRHAQTSVKLSMMWMDFVVKHCPRGRGWKPSWANQGLDYVSWSTDPTITAHITQEEYHAFRDKVQICMLHIVGGSVIRCLPEGKILINRSASNQSLGSLPSSDSTANLANGMVNLRLGPSSISSMTPNVAGEKSVAAPRHHLISTGSTSSLTGVGAVHATSPGSSTVTGHVAPAKPWVERARIAVANVEEAREKKLNKLRLVGHVTDVKPMDDDVHQYMKKVNFRWQKGIKIGAGQWKVYTAVNLDTGQLMAMKKITLASNSNQQLRTIADEIQNFEAIKHPNLVRYFGVEVHRNELLIFMEYCPGGSLAEACKGGLPESTVRRYTRSILTALSVLHDHGIVHRDIKGANIFLTADGAIKVGDFGCAQKLRLTVTTTGDVKGMAGTIAYMAPCVIRNETGKIGRAADIWALGCVVIELFTGYPPWHELENQYQIMYKVGTGSHPEFPRNLSEEGKQFLGHCFEEEPRRRATAQTLLEHPFVKVDDHF